MEVEVEKEGSVFVEVVVVWSLWWMWWCGHGHCGGCHGVVVVVVVVVWSWWWRWWCVGGGLIYIWLSAIVPYLFP